VKTVKNRQIKAALYLAIVMLGILTVFPGACSDGNTPEPPPGDEIIIRNAPIHEVHVRIAESYPPQVFVYIQGGLADGCTTFNDLTTERAGNTLTITVTVRRPKDTMCTAIYTYFEKDVALGSDFVSGETYTVKVNDYVTGFTMQ
jgi:hypothetical protein